MTELRDIEHSRYSASGMATWSVCTRQPEMAADCERSTNGAAARGTVLHHIAEAMLKDESYPAVGETVHCEGHDITITDDDMSDLHVYVGECKPLMRDADWYIIEERLDMDALWGGEPPFPLFSYPDFIAVRGETCFVYDLKTGRIPASPYPQLMYYAGLALLNMPPEIMANVKEFETAIIQPKLNEMITYKHVATEDLIDWMHNVLKPIIDEIAAGNTELVPGDHCKWCPAAGKCPALNTMTVDVLDVEEISADMELPQPAAMSLADIGRILEAIPMLKRHIEAIEEEAVRRMMEGHKIPGFKPVEKRAIRKYKDESAEIAVAKLLKGWGYEPAKFVETKLISPAKLEKMLKGHDDQVVEVERYWEAKSSGHTYAHIDDKRETAAPAKQPTLFDVTGPMKLAGE